MDLRLLRDLFDDGIEVAFCGPDGRSRDGAFKSAAEDLDAGGGGHARHGVESFLRVANLIQGFRLEQRLHFRRARLSRGPEDDRVSLRQRACVEDRIERDPEAFLLLHLEDRPDRGAVRRGELLLQESLRQADEHQEEVGNAFAKFRTDRDDRDVRRGRLSRPERPEIASMKGFAGVLVCLLAASGPWRTPQQRSPNPRLYGIVQRTQST